jgi:hypothetical protein
MTLDDINDKDLLRGALYSSVRLAITRHNIELEPDTATEQEVSEDAAGACFGEECCEDVPIPEVSELMVRLEHRTALLDALRTAKPYIEFYAGREMKSPSNNQQAVIETREMLSKVRKVLEANKVGS